LSLGSADAVHCKLAARLGCGDGEGKDANSCKEIQS